MADRIKGIKIEIDGDTTGLTTALGKVNRELSSTKSALRDVDRLLKLDPENTTLLEQKQRLLAKAISETKQRLDTLREAERQAQEQFKRGEISQEQYEALQREIIATESELNKLEKAAKGSEDALGKAGDAAEDAGQSIKDAGEKAQQGAEMIARGSDAILASVAALATAVATSGIKFNKELEGYSTSFEVMTGSASKATAITNELKNIAAHTPFEINNLASTTQLLMNYGLAADEAVESLMMLGDISQGDAQKLNSVALAYGQMRSAGKVTLQDIKQMINAGFNPLQEIAESTGESMESIYDRISKGTISVEEITAAMQRSTSQGGKYFKSMEKQARTLEGQWSTLKDTAAETSGEIMKGFSKWLSSKGLPKAIELVSDLSNNYKRIIPIIASATVAALALKTALTIGDTVQSFSKLIAALGTTEGYIGLVVAAFALLAGAIAAANQPSPGMEIWSRQLDGLREKTAGLMEQMSQQQAQYESSLQSIEATALAVDGYIERLEELEQQGELTDQEQEEWKNILQILEQMIPGISGLINDQTLEIEGGTQALKNYVLQWKKTQLLEVLATQHKQALEDMMIAQDNLNEATNMYRDASERMGRTQRDANGIMDTARTKFGFMGTTIWEAYEHLAAFRSENAEENEEARLLAQQAMNVALAMDENSQKVAGATTELKNAQQAAELARTKMQNLEQAFKDVSTGAADFSDIMRRDMERSGANAIQGAINGAYSKRKSLVDTYSSLAGAAVDAFNKRMKIHSPSRVMMESGENTMEGAIIGAEKKLPQWRRTMEQAAEIATDAGAQLRSGDQITNDSRTYGGISINVYGAAGQDERQLAQIIMEEIQAATMRREAALA